MNILKKYKKMKRQVEGLCVIKAGLEVQREQARWHKDHSCISESERHDHELIYRVLDKWYQEADKALRGDLNSWS